MYDGEICKDCGQPASHGIGVTFWNAPNDLWNFVMGGPEATDDPGGVLCCSCFWRRCRELGIHIAWRAEPVGYRFGPADSETSASLEEPDSEHYHRAMAKARAVQSPASSPRADGRTRDTDGWPLEPDPAIERCPICEGVDQPGLLHNERAPYCSQRIIEGANVELRRQIAELQEQLEASKESTMLAKEMRDEQAARVRELSEQLQTAERGKL